MIVRALGIVAVLSTMAQAYTVLNISSGAPVGIERDLIASVTAQYQAKVVKNPYVSNTYAVTIYGLNPAFNPLPTNAQLLDSVVTVDSWTYVHGWANGEQYERHQDMSFVGYYDVHCSSPTLFDLLQASTSTWDVGTCEDALSTLNNRMYQLFFDTPTVIPSNWQ
jgi:hypothetical protein